jgi:Hydrolases of the alpha/beta superfamily
MASIVGNRPLNLILSIAGIVLVVATVLVGLLSVFQERIAFQPQGPPYPRVDSSVRVGYSAADGQQLIGYVVGRPDSAHGLLLAFHGNADMAALQIGWAEEVVARTGMVVMLAEYRGYAGLTGKPGYKESQLDADAAYAYAREKLHIPANRIAFFGHSLGTAVAVELATRSTPFAILLQSPFTSARDMARILIGHRPSAFMWNLVSRIHFNTVGAVSKLDVPVSVVHGGRDRLIPLAMGEEVFAAAKVKGQWLVIPDAAHNDVAVRGGEPYWRWIQSSLEPTTPPAVLK